MLLFLDKLKNGDRVLFARQVQALARALKIPPEWLMLLMWHESRLNSQAYNQTGGAAGLIQFMPATAAGLGTSTAQLANMDANRQMYYVAKYFASYAGKIKSYADLHLITFFPAVLGLSDKTIIQSPKLSAEIIASQNTSFDLNKNGVITIGEFKDYIKSFIKKNVPKEYLQKFNTKAVKTIKITIAVLTIIIAGLSIYVAVKSL